MSNPLGFWAVADAFPDRPAVADPDHAVRSFGQMAELSNRIGHGLRALGLGPGDQVTTVLPNGFEQIGTSLAALQTGLYSTAVNWHLVGPEIAYIVNDSETRVLIVHERFAGEAGRVLEEISVPESHRFAVGTIPGFRPFAELVGGQPSSRPDQRTTGSVMFYTSGTTGRPKGVRRALSGVDPDVFASGRDWLLSMFGITPHDDGVHVTQAPLYHTAATGWTLNSLHMGHLAVLMDKWTPLGALERYERYRVTTSHMVPTMFNRLLALPEEDRTRFDLSSMRQMVHAAAPCPVETKYRMLEWWGPVIWEYYAATEGGGTIVSPQDWLAHPGTVGRPWPNSEVVIVDADGNPCPPGVSGTIYFHTANSESFEYFKDKDKTERSRRGALLTVGDVGYFDEDGWLFLNDRAADMIIAGGVNIYPAEIEGALVQHPKIVDVAVFGIPNPDLGEEIKAVVEPIEGVTPGPELADEILQWATTRIARYKLPRSIDFVDALPRDPNGKLYKRRLRDPYWADRTRAI